MLADDPLPLRPHAEQTMYMATRRRHWTSADVRDLMDESRAWPRYELIEGELLVTPAPRMAHQVTVAELMVILREYLAANPIGRVFISPSDLELRPDEIVQPDVFVVPSRVFEGEERLAEWSDVDSLLLAIEIVSPSNARQDRVLKRDFYMDAGVDEYWIVDLDARVIERWTPAQETPVLIRERLDWRPLGAGTSLEVRLPELFDRIAKQAGVARRLV